MEAMISRVSVAAVALTSVSCGEEATEHQTARLPGSLREAQTAANGERSGGLEAPEQPTEVVQWGAGRKATPGAIVEAWMDSPPHRANNTDFGARRGRR